MASGCTPDSDEMLMMRPHCLFLHVRQRRARGANGRQHVELINLEPFFVREIIERSKAARPARVVHQNMNRAESPHRFLNRPFRPIGVGHVRSDGMHRRAGAAHFRSRRLKLLRIAAIDHHLHALARQCFRDRPANSLARSGHHSYFVFKSEFHRKAPSRFGTASSG